MKKRYVVAIVIVILLVALAVFGITRGKVFDKSSDTKNNHTTNEHELLPEVDAYYGSEKIASILGYKTEVGSNYIRDNIVPVESSRVIPVKIINNGRTIVGMKYEVRSTEDSRLIDNGEAKQTENTEKTTLYEINASAILQSGQEYQLVLTLETNNNENIYYYTRVMVMNDSFVDGQIAFAKQFSSSTLGQDTELNIATYLEPDEDLKNDDLGYTTLSSSYKMLQWSEMKPELQGKVNVSAKEFCIKDSGEAGTYTLEYQVKASNAEGVEETYNVSETIVVWTFSGQNYVLNYNREINQVWEANDNNVGKAFIDLGIQNQKTIDVAESENGQYIGFEINGDVYTMDLTSNGMKKLFALDVKSVSENRMTKAKMIQTDDKGNANFLVYGYSRCNEHLGENGISVFNYDKESNESKELLFIPFSQPAEMIDKQIHKLCYVNDGTIYFMLDNSLYYVNIGTKESGKIVENMPDGSYAINQSKTAIAYNTDLTTMNSDSITVIDLTTGKEKKLTGENGEKLSACGYTGNNLIYGITKPENVSDSMRIDTLKIIDKDYNEITSYSSDNTVITGVEITDTIINMKREKKGKAISDDQLIDNTEKLETKTKSSYFADTLKLKELAISFVNQLSGKNELKVEEASIKYKKSTEVNTIIKPAAQDQYFVYAGGNLFGIYYNQNEAETVAKTNKGLVTDYNGQKIWTFEENYE